MTVPLLVFFFLGALFLTICSSSLLHLGKFKSKELLKSTRLLRLVSRQNVWENLYFCLSVAGRICELGFAIAAFFALLDLYPEIPHLAVGFIIITLATFLDIGARILGTVFSRRLLKMTAPFASLYLILFSPLVAPLLKITRALAPPETEPTITDRSRLREMIHESELQRHLDPTDQKLISSFLSFKERVAKEIMVPRVDIFSLPASTTLRDAARLFAEEGYSRIPIYNETLDQITGVALYKDLLKCFESGNFDDSLKTIAKPVLYAPENKKIAQLLQEFRSKQIHMAIIVDEYGGTEGIVTIEDILEELVGEIEDESDIGDKDYSQAPNGGWIVDAKMTLIDIDNQLGIKIPENPDYETLGGYVYHCAGTIPSKGWRLSHDEFDLEVLSSNERSLDKIQITPRTKLE